MFSTLAILCVILFLLYLFDENFVLFGIILLFLWGISRVAFSHAAVNIHDITNKSQIAEEYATKENKEQASEETNHQFQSKKDEWQY